MKEASEKGPKKTEKEQARAMILRIAKKLRAENIGEIKHWCDDYIPNKMNEPIRVLQCLEKAEMYTLEDFKELKELLKTINRNDLKNEIKEFEEERAIRKTKREKETKIGVLRAGSSPNGFGPRFCAECR